MLELHKPSSKMFIGFVVRFYIFTLFLGLTSGQALYRRSMGTNNGPLCKEDGSGCDYDHECCNESCRMFICYECRRFGYYCYKNSQCCSGYCTNFTCGPCTTNERFCTYNSDCCSGYCINLRCGACKENGSFCFLHSDCCSDFCVREYLWFICARK
ncbi:unnamed protein product [Allacma fusca]|uniref:Uncharacterized protein n=1 Tax=Allacma fusca TaxID=39272 RepID=A0A8J2PQN7_9HEXA|nr:unnamed protein product [Allacma fusca]